MRLMFIAFAVAIFLIVDQLRFSGYYRQNLFAMVDKGAARIGHMLR